MGPGLRLTQGTSPRWSHAWPQYVITTSWLAARGQLPWRLAGFLEESRRLQILRQRGVAYQFRHARLRDHLADTER